MKTPHYTEIKVRRWKFLPRVKIGFLFDVYAWHLLYIDSEIELQDASKMDTTELLRKMLFNAARSWAKEKGKLQWFCLQDIDDMLENISRKDFDELNKTFIMSFAETTKGLNSRNEKKKK